MSFSRFCKPLLFLGISSSIAAASTYYYYYYYSRKSFKEKEPNSHSIPPIIRYDLNESGLTYNINLCIYKDEEYNVEYILHMNSYTGVPPLLEEYLKDSKLAKIKVRKERACLEIISYISSEEKKVKKKSTTNSTGWMEFCSTFKGYVNENNCELYKNRKFIVCWDPKQNNFLIDLHSTFLEEPKNSNFSFF